MVTFSREEFFGMAGIANVDGAYTPVSLGKGAEVRDGSRSWIQSLRNIDFIDSNLEFMDNTIVVADNMYGRLNPMRYLARRRARQFRELLDRFGWDAYVAAIMERKNGQH